MKLEGNTSEEPHFQWNILIRPELVIYFYCDAVTLNILWLNIFSSTYMFPGQWQDRTGSNRSEDVEWIHKNNPRHVNQNQRSVSNPQIFNTANEQQIEDQVNCVLAALLEWDKCTMTDKLGEARDVQGIDSRFVKVIVFILPSLLLGFILWWLNPV